MAPARSAGFWNRGEAPFKDFQIGEPRQPWSGWELLNALLDMNRGLPKTI
jgi:hypothetical protein